VTLAQAFLVGPENERHVCEPRRGGAQRSIDQDLLRRVRDVIVAAHHVRDRHVDVVAHDGELVRRLPVGSHDHEVLDRRVIDRDLTVHAIVERRLALGHAHAHGPRRAVGLECGDLGGVERQAPAIVLPRGTALLGRLSCRLKSFRRAVTVVGVTAGEEPLGHGTMPIQALGLEIRPVIAANFRPFIPVEPQPTKSVEDAVHHLSRRSLEVRVLDAKHERAAVTAGEQPVEERGARAADVQIARRRRREADARYGHRIS
jgi:hypothetical protein